MPIIDGEKYACSSCIKGHRVSGCQHGDRELHHINPKGRPVKQCEHCRGARKATSHHARCDCGSKKKQDQAKDKLKTDIATAGNVCCCYNGSKCICGMKKDLKLDTNLPKNTTQLIRTKPRLTSANSEGTLTFLQNGHHKPCHRLNNSAHTSGAPYKIPRNVSQAGFQSQTGTPQPQTLRDRRSVDDFGYVDTTTFPLFPTSIDSVNSFPTTADSDFQPDSATFFYGSNPGASVAASDRSSPVDSQPPEPFGLQQWPWSTPTSQPTQYAMDMPLSASPTHGDFAAYENDWALPSAGAGNNSFFSSGDLPLNPGKLNKAITPPISLSCDSNMPSAPGLTSGSSGPQSEAGDPVYADSYDYSTSQTNLNDLMLDDVLSIRTAERGTPFRITNASKRPEFRQPPTSVPPSSRRSLDLDHTSPPGEVYLSATSASMDPDRTYAAMNVQVTQRARSTTTSSLPYATPEEDIKPFNYHPLRATPRSMTMPSTPANNMVDIQSWTSSVPFTGSSIDVTAPSYAFEEPASNGNFGW